MRTLAPPSLWALLVALTAGCGAQPRSVELVLHRFTDAPAQSHRLFLLRALAQDGTRIIECDDLRSTGTARNDVVLVHEPTLITNTAKTELPSIVVGDTLALLEGYSGSDGTGTVVANGCARFFVKKGQSIELHATFAAP